MSKKEDALKNELSGIKKKSLKKNVSNIAENEAITKKVYKSSTSKSKKTTIDLPEDVHLRAKIVAMEERTTLKNYILELILADLDTRGEK